MAAPLLLRNNISSILFNEKFLIHYGGNKHMNIQVRIFLDNVKTRSTSDIVPLYLNTSNCDNVIVDVVNRKFTPARQRLITSRYLGLNYYSTCSRVLQTIVYAKTIAATDPASAAKVDESIKSVGIPIFISVLAKQVRLTGQVVNNLGISFQLRYTPGDATLLQEEIDSGDFSSRLSYLKRNRFEGTIPYDESPSISDFTVVTYNTVDVLSQKQAKEFLKLTVSNAKANKERKSKLSDSEKGETQVDEQSPNDVDPVKEVAPSTPSFNASTLFVRRDEILVVNTGWAFWSAFRPTLFDDPGSTLVNDFCLIQWTNGVTEIGPGRLAIITFNCVDYLFPKGNAPKEDSRGSRSPKNSGSNRSNASRGDNAAKDSDDSAMSLELKEKPNRAAAKSKLRAAQWPEIQKKRNESKSSKRRGNNNPLKFSFNELLSEFVDYVYSSMRLAST